MSVTELQMSIPVHLGMLVHLSTIVMVGPLLQGFLNPKLTQVTDFFALHRFLRPLFRHRRPDSMRPPWLHPPQLNGWAVPGMLPRQCFPDNDVWC
jgi:hypothetical protein